MLVGIISIQKVLLASKGYWDLGQCVGLNAQLNMFCKSLHGAIGNKKKTPRLTVIALKLRAYVLESAGKLGIFKRPSLPHSFHFTSYANLLFKLLCAFFSRARPIA